MLSTSNFFQGRARVNNTRVVTSIRLKGGRMRTKDASHEDMSLALANRDLVIFFLLGQLGTYSSFRSREGLPLSLSIKMFMLSFKLNGCLF